ncbi:4-amino-4-deoxy-L-arabinose transferase [Hymenobacter daecheongensis DSM 21074]|uniref:4-amino-4-deoxy-L-arabinose transferase n=1 Tax=Hymenobacter daecheongensis DSM 21074 TaxID=1121955 RepID=A0A1M6CB70_9BACT|nr:hypothetical protein [Hymenobacter daecheongensis]SHI58061.1 4-amino-4-deoxy-L-arabinose transferase [Hymenobacter daecheongensis DSM 21074]
MAAKNDNLPRKNALWLLLALLLVAGLRLYGLSAAALPDYDSVRNWQIVQEVAQGNLRNLFHHGSPGFSLLYAPVAWFTDDFRVFQYLNVLLAVAAVGGLAAFVGREARLKPPETALLALLIGSSVFLTFSGRDFTMGSASLVVFVGLLQAYYQRLRQPARAALLLAALWLMLGLCINYKLLLALPILVVFELLQRDGLFGQRGTWWRVLGLLAAPYVVLSAVGMAVGLPWYRWAGVYYNIAFPGAANAAGRVGSFQLDLFYYFQFLRDFESPVVLLALVTGPWLWRRELFGGLRRINLVRYLAVWAYCYLAGMSLLLKAPRGLLLAYGLFYALAFLSLRRVLPARAVVAVLLMAVGLNVYRIQREIYAYTPSNYGEVAAWLHAHGARRVASTVGQGLAPFAPMLDSLTVITHENQLPALRRRGYRYVLLDAYWRVAGVAHFEELARQPALAAWPEPLLTSPLLFLEHSEYTGLSYAQTLARQQAARRDSLQLRLLPL